MSGGGVARGFDMWDVACAAMSSMVPAVIAVMWYLGWGDMHPVMAVGFIIVSSMIPGCMWWTALVSPLLAGRQRRAVKSNRDGRVR